METAISTLNLLPSTKRQVDVFTSKIKDEILSGYENPLKFAVILKCMEETIERLRSDNDITKSCLSEAEKYSKGVIDEYGASILVCELGTKYNYSVCNDSVLDELNKKIKSLTEQKKKRESFLKTLDEFEVANSDTGEQLMPPVKTSKTGLKITLK